MREARQGPLKPTGGEVPRKSAAPFPGRVLALILLPALLFGLVTFEHRWRWFEGAVGRGVELGPEGSFVVTGGIHVEGSSYGVVLLRVDSLGDTSWVRHVTNLDAYGGYSARLDAGDYAVAAMKDGGRVWVHRFDAEGDSAWTALSVTEGRVFAVSATPDGGCLVAGMIPDTISDFGVVKLAAAGQEDWARYYEELRVFESWARGVARTPDGGFILTGDCTDYVDSYIRLVRADSAGEVRWSRLYSGPVGPRLNAVCPTADGGFLTVGSEFDTVDSRDVLYVMRLDSAGEVIGARPCAPAGAATFGNAMAPTGDGGYIIAGQIAWRDSARVWLVRADSAGDTLWSRVLGGSGREAAHAVRQARDGGFIVAGGSDADGGSLLLIKTDSLGDGHTGVASGEADPAAGMTLSAGPCPARTAATLRIVLDRAGPVRLDVRDVVGRLVATPVRALLPAGEHVVDWPTAGLGPGTYFCSVRLGSRLVTRPLVITR